MYVIYHICFFQYMLYACILHDSFFCVWINFMLSWILMIFFVWELPMKESPSLEGEAARLESWYENTVGLASEKYGFNHLRLAELHVFKFNPSSFQVFFKTHPIPRGEPGFSLQHTQSKMPSHFKIPSKNVYVYIYICIFLLHILYMYIYMNTDSKHFWNGDISPKYHRRATFTNMFILLAAE